MGSMGYYVWKSNSNKTENTVTSDKASVSTEKTTSEVSDKQKTMQSASFDSGLGVDVSLSYPDTWAMVASKLTKDSGSVGQSISLTAPDKSLTVQYDINNFGLGGACMPEEQGVITTINVEKVVGYDKVKYVELATSNSKSGSGRSSFSLMSTDKVTSTAIGKSECSLYLADVVGLGGVNDVHMITSIKPKDSSDSLSNTNYNTVMKGTYYAEAKAILLSTVVK